MGVLAASSFFFYGWWDYYAIPVIVVSIAFNFALANAIGRSYEPLRKKGLVWLGVVGNLGLLGYFKYMNFAVENLDELFGVSIGVAHVVLPLAISFYTF